MLRDVHMMESLPDFETLPPQTVHALAALAVGIGVLYCFLGYRTLKAVLALTGFALAAAVAGALAAVISGNHVLAVGISALIGGLSGAMALLFIYRAGVFCVGLLGGLVASHSVLSGVDDTWAPWAILGAAVAGGVAALAVERLVLTAATAAVGAWLIVCGLAYFVIGPVVLEAVQNPEVLGDRGWTLFLSWGVLAVTGTFAQLAAQRRKKPGMAKSA
jgi:hypothetical protein